MISRSSHSISAFDLDRTLYRGNSSFQFCLYLIRKKVLPKRALFFSLLYGVQHEFFSLSLERLHQKIFARVLKGFSLPLLQAEGEKFVAQIADTFFYAPALTHLRQAQQLGDRILLLSNAPSFLVCPMAKKLGIAHWKASEYKADEEQRLSAIGFLMQGEEKAKEIELWMKKEEIAREDVVAYSDSYHDLPFLLKAGRAVAVNPDRKLRKFSQNARWLIL